MFKKLVKRVKKMVKSVKAKLMKGKRPKQGFWIDYYTAQPVGTEVDYEIHVVVSPVNTKTEQDFYSSHLGLEVLFQQVNTMDVYDTDLGIGKLFEGCEGAEEAVLSLDLLFEHPFDDYDEALYLEMLFNADTKLVDSSISEHQIEAKRSGLIRYKSLPCLLKSRGTMMRLPQHKSVEALA